jgi:hypothetical protein
MKSITICVKGETLEEAVDLLVERALKIAAEQNRCSQEDWVFNINDTLGQNFLVAVCR